MAKGSIVVRILSQWSDKGVKAATKDLEKSTKDFQNFSNKVGKAFLLAGAAAAAFAVKVGVDAVKAAMEDQKSAALLANTLHNVVGANNAVVASVEDFISQTSIATGVVDDQLRPAFAKLVAATRDVTGSQALLQLALDASAGTGNELDAVSAALAKAYNGNYGQLQRLVPALDKNIVKTKDFQAAVKFLADTYGGSAQAKAQTFEGQLARIKVALGETKEAIGYGLLPVLTALADKITKEVIPAILEFVNNNGDKIVGVFKTGVGYVVAFAKAIYDAFDFVARNIKVFASLGAVIVAAFVGAKVAAAVSTIIDVITKLRKLYQTLAAAATTAAAAQALLTGGLSAAAGAAAFAGALIAVNLAMKKFNKDANAGADALGELKFNFNAGKISAADYLKGLKGLETQQNKNSKATKELTADQKKALEVLAQLKKMGIVPRGEDDPIQLEAARLNLIKQNNLAEAERIAKIQQAIIDQQALNLASQRYVDILQVLADAKISPEEVLVLAQKWGITTGQVVEYIARIYAANSTDTDDSAIIKLYMTWGMTKEQAQKYVDFTRALKDEKLDDTEIRNLMNKWGMTREQVIAYAKKVQEGTVFSSTWADPGNAAAKSWQDALAALQEYINKVKEATGTPIPKPTVPAPGGGVTGGGVTGGGVTGGGVTGGGVTGGGVTGGIAAQIATIIGGTQGAGTGSTQVPFGTVIPGAPSPLEFIPTSMLNPNLYGAGKIPLAALSTAVSKAANPAISNLAKRTGEIADIAALGQNPSAYVSSATSGTLGGATTIIVQGNLVTQADNVAAIRNDLLNNQLSGKPMTFSAVSL